MIPRVYTFGRYCLGGGCWNVVIDPRFDYCPDCWQRVRDLAEEAAQELIQAAELFLMEEL